MKSQSLPPLNQETVLTLLGEDEGARKKALDAALEQIVPTARDFNLSVYRADKDEWQNIIATLHQSPMMSARRAVVVEAIDKLKVSEADALLRYLENPVPSSLLLIVGTKLDGKRKYAKVLKKSGPVLEFGTPKPYQLPQWLQDEARTQNIDIDHATASLIVDLVGHQPDLLRSTLTLLHTYVGDDNRITQADVEGLLANTREASVFELVDAVSKRNLIASIRLLRAALGRGESPIAILSHLIRHYRQLAKCQALLQSNVPQGEWSKHIGNLHPFVLKKLQEQARSVSPNIVLGQLMTMYSYETELKRRYQESDSIIEHIITGLI